MFTSAKSSKLWTDKDVIEIKNQVVHLTQKPQECVPTSLAMITSQTPDKFYGVNSQDPISW